MVVATARHRLQVAFMKVVGDQNSRLRQGCQIRM